MARPLVMRCGAFGDMVLVTALIQQLHARFGTPVDVITSGGWARPLLSPRPAAGEIYTLRSRRTPYWLDREQQALVRQLRERGAEVVELPHPGGHQIYAAVLPEIRRILADLPLPITRSPE